MNSPVGDSYSDTFLASTNHSPRSLLPFLAPGHGPHPQAILAFRARHQGVPASWWPHSETVCSIRRSRLIDIACPPIFAPVPSPAHQPRLRADRLALKRHTTSQIQPDAGLDNRYTHCTDVDAVWRGREGRLGLREGETAAHYYLRAQLAPISPTCDCEYGYEHGPRQLPGP